MNIISAIKYVKFKDVARALRFHYVHPKISKKIMKRYEEIMNEISKYPNKEITDWELRVDLVPAYRFYLKKEKKWYDDIKIGEEYYTTHAKNHNDKEYKYYYAIEFTRWETSSQWKISTDVLKKYTLPEIIAHYLWEITFCGYTQTPIKKHLKEIHKRIKQVKSYPDKYSVSVDLDKLKNFGK